MAKKLKESNFDLNDFLEQFDNLAKMGDLNELIGMMPGAGKLKIDKDAKVDKKEVARMKAIIQSMTQSERTNPKILNYSRKKRIAAGSGTNVQDVNKIIKQYDQMRELMKKMNGKNGMKAMKGKGFKLPF